MARPSRPAEARQPENVEKPFVFLGFLYGGSAAAARRQRGGSATAAQPQRDGSATAARRQRPGNDNSAPAEDVHNKNPSLALSGKMFGSQGFRGQEPFHDVPCPSGINFALVDAQNAGLASIFDKFCSFLNILGLVTGFLGLVTGFLRLPMDCSGS